MDKKEKKEELIGKLLGRYANQEGLSIIKIGEDSISKDALTRLNRANAQYRGEIQKLKDIKRRNEKKIKKLLGFEVVQEQQEEFIKTQTEEIKNLNKQMVELKAELKIRRKNDNRFDILDL